CRRRSSPTYSLFLSLGLPPLSFFLLAMRADSTLHLHPNRLSGRHDDNHWQRPGTRHSIGPIESEGPLPNLQSFRNRLANIPGGLLVVALCALLAAPGCTPAPQPVTVTTTPRTTTTTTTTTTQ